RFLDESTSVLRDVPAARQAAVDAGLVPVLEKWTAAGAGRHARRDNREAAALALRALGTLKPGEKELPRLVVPQLAGDRNADVRAAALRVLGDKEHAWAVPLIVGVLKECLAGSADDFRTVVWAAAQALGDIGDPAPIPVLIGVIDADNTY